MKRTESDNEVELRWQVVSIGEADIRLMDRRSDRVLDYIPVPDTSTQVVVDPPPCIVFHSFDQLTTALTAYFESTHQEFSTRNSITVENANESVARVVKFPENDVRFKYASMTYVCKHGRTQKRRNNPDLTKSKRVKFAYSGCQACIWVSLVLLGLPGQRRWVYHVHKMVNVHNHDLSAENQVASLRPFRMYLDEIYDMKHAGASPQDILQMLAAKEPNKKITIQTVRNILRNYAKELEAPARPVVVSWRLSLDPLPEYPSLPFYQLFTTLAKHVVEYGVTAPRLLYLNMCSVSSNFRRTWKPLTYDGVNQQQTEEKTFHATVLTAIAADGSSAIRPFCVFANHGTDRPQLTPNTITTPHGHVTPEAFEYWMIYLQSALHPNLARPIILIVDHVTISSALEQISRRYGIYIVSWKDLYLGMKDIVAPLRRAIFEPFEARLCQHLGNLIPHLSTIQALTAEFASVAAVDYHAATVDRQAVRNAFLSTGLMPLNLPILAAPLGAAPPVKATYVVEEHRTSTITVQSNAMPRYYGVK
ncbi:hypothetical protein LEN26_002391 [Aphanomyces euteiches]|nr:hypothetical protein AeMF1_001538 [Aphanomyces euteiches]KAH9159332.1 hypothetical protein LEN26_002391 [Aphanomyces euteiches]